MYEHCPSRLSVPPAVAASTNEKPSTLVYQHLGDEPAMVPRDNFELYPTSHLPPGVRFTSFRNVPQSEVVI